RRAHLFYPDSVGRTVGDARETVSAVDGIHAGRRVSRRRVGRGDACNNSAAEQQRMGGVDRVAAARTMSMWAVALLPLALYLLWIGVTHLRRRPSLVSGSRDILAVFLAAFGAVALGPMELFMPEAAAVRFGPLAWLQLVILYVLNVALVVLIMRPRAVLYNMTREQARTALARVLEQLGAPAVWAGDTLAVPAWELEVRLDQSGILRQVQLISVGPRTSYEGWVR